MTGPRVALAVLALGGVAAGHALAAVVDPATIDQQELCLACHDDVGEQTELPVAHPPAQGGKCSACHNPHASRNERLLLDRPAILCAECHELVTESLARPVVHAPAAEGRCTGCHEPHGGTHEGLLVAEGEELCAECHDELEIWRERSVLHGPFERGQCARCHEPHAAEHDGLSNQPGGAACARCHPVSAAFTAKHNGYPVERADCQQCHDPHASAQPGLFRERQHPPFADGDCGTCHLSAGSDEPFGVVARLDSLCGECHEDQVTESREAPFPHVGAGGVGCTNCHNPHAGVGAGLLNDSLTETCFECHDPGGASSEEEGRHTTHAGDMACTVCHDPHGGDRPLLLVDDPIQLCGGCHSHQHSISHPMGDRAADPRTGRPLDCLSCHGLHDAPHEKYLHRSGEREICVGCHKAKAGGSR